MSKKKLLHFHNYFLTRGVLLLVMVSVRCGLLLGSVEDVVGARGQAKETPPASDSPSLSSQLSTGLDRDRDTTGTTSSHVCVCG